MTSDIFIKNLPLLETIFGKIHVANKTTRLKEIFDSTEISWLKNLDRFGDKKIEKVLIAEAAPWSESGIPRFFYNQIESSYHQRIWRAFFPNSSVPADKEKSFLMLADKNFLLIDTIPFSISYSGVRNHPNYLAIIRNSLDWWATKLKNEKLSFAPKVKIAFAFKVNGQKIIRATNGQLILKDGRRIKLTEEQVAADGSGYTNSEKLRKIFEL